MIEAAYISVVSFFIPYLAYLNDVNNDLLNLGTAQVFIATITANLLIMAYTRYWTYIHTISIVVP